MKSTLHNYFGTKKIQIIFLINVPIADVIIGDMLWDPEDIEGQTHANMMACFEKFADKSEALACGQGLDRYRDVIKNNLQSFSGLITSVWD